MNGNENLEAPLDQFYRDVFLPDWLNSCNESVLQRYTQAVDWFLIFCGSKATIEDLADDALNGFTEWLVQTKRADRKNRFNNAARVYASRLRQIRRYASARSHEGTRDMRLCDFLKNIYLRERPLMGASAAKYRQSIDSLSEFWGSEIMLSEVSGELLDSWQEWAKQFSSSSKRQRENLLAIWRLAFDMGFVATEDPQRKEDSREGAPVITAGDSLRMICTAKYFPAKWSIRSPGTKDQYRFALNDFAEYLGRESTIADLRDDRIMKFMRWLVDTRQLAPKTVNERKGRLISLWKWLHARGYVTTLPTVENIPYTPVAPKAWTQQELTRMFDACKNAPGNVGRVPANEFWTAFMMFLWNTGERVSAALEVEWSHIGADGICHLPGSIRKGGREAFYRLWPETLAALQQLRRDGEPKVFPYPHCRAMLYRGYRQLLHKAGLPTDRRDMFHKMRRSFATWLRVAGHDDTRALGHSSSDVTERSYRDPRIIGTQPVVLFKPWETAAGRERDA